MIRDIIRNGNRVNNNIIFDSSPKRLVERLIKIVEEQKERKEMGDIDMVEELKAKV